MTTSFLTNRLGILVRPFLPSFLPGEPARLGIRYVSVLLLLLLLLDERVLVVTERADLRDLRSLFLDLASLGTRLRTSLSRTISTSR